MPTLVLLAATYLLQFSFPHTLEPVLKDHPYPLGVKLWSLKAGPLCLLTGAIVFEIRDLLAGNNLPGVVVQFAEGFCKKYVVLQDRWSLMAVDSQDRFHQFTVVFC